METTTKTEQKIKLNRGMAGNYGWEITITSDEINLRDLKELDEALRKLYLEPEE